MTYLSISLLQTHAVPPCTPCHLWVTQYGDTLPTWVVQQLSVCKEKKELQLTTSFCSCLCPPVPQQLLCCMVSTLMLLLDLVLLRQTCRSAFRVTYLCWNLSATLLTDFCYFSTTFLYFILFSLQHDCGFKQLCSAKYSRFKFKAKQKGPHPELNLPL